MRIKFADLWLSGGGLEGSSGLSVNGDQVIDDAQFFRALATKHYARGNDSTAVSFTVAREHASEKAAEVYVITHRKNLPKEGDLIFYCGFPGNEQQVALLGAVLSSTSADYIGRTSFLTFTLLGGLPQTDSIPEGEEIDEEVTRRGTVNIADGATTVSVTYSTMTGAPYVTVTVYAPSGGDAIFGTVVDGSITSSGFDVILSGPTPNGDYKLGYIAIL